MKLPATENDVVLLHNPRCSKSRATKALLEQNKIAFVERLYLEDPLSRAELEELQARLGRSVRDWVRKGQVEYGVAGLDANSDEGAVLDAMSGEPVLMERPIVVRGKDARIGRPPENVLELFD